MILNIFLIFKRQCQFANILENSSRHVSRQSFYPTGSMGGLDCSTTICHRYTPAADLHEYLATADIVVTAAGVPNLIRGQHLKPGACVVDVAINRVKDEATGKMKMVGDCHFECEL